MERLKDKMYNYEVNPPNHCWEKISIAMDDAELGHKFPPALYNMEVTPPASAWAKISEAMNAKTEAVVRPMFRRQSPLLKYAAAAILIGLVAFAVLRLVISNNNPDNGGTVAKKSDTIKSADSFSPVPNAGVTSESDPESGVESSEANKNLVASLDPPVKKIVKGSDPGIGTNKIRKPTYSETELSQSIYAYEDHVPDISERYVMLMTPDGNFIRMAKKWSDLLCCVSGEEQDADCKNQLKKWQQKIAASTLAPSPSNFMDILGLVNSLQENTEL